MVNPTEETQLIQPWYKQFWPWFIISLPASAVVGGIITLIIATENADSLVVDDYYKAGLAINAQFSQQKNAAKYGFAATMKRLPDNRLFIKFDRAIPDTDSVDLYWIHPADSEKDFQVTLRKQNDGSFQAKTDNELSGRWYLRLTNESDWLIKSEIRTGVDTVKFTPRLN